MKKLQSSATKLIKILLKKESGSIFINFTITLLKKTGSIFINFTITLLKKTGSIFINFTITLLKKTGSVIKGPFNIILIEFAHLCDAVMIPLNALDEGVPSACGLFFDGAKKTAVDVGIGVTGSVALAKNRIKINLRVIAAGIRNNIKLFFTLAGNRTQLLFAGTLNSIKLLLAGIGLSTRTFLTGLQTDLNKFFTGLKSSFILFKTGVQYTYNHFILIAGSNTQSYMQQTGEYPNELLSILGAKIGFPFTLICSFCGSLLMRITTGALTFLIGVVKNLLIFFIASTKNLLILFIGTISSLLAFLVGVINNIGAFLALITSDVGSCLIGTIKSFINFFSSIVTEFINFCNGLRSSLNLFANGAVINGRFFFVGVKKSILDGLDVLMTIPIGALILESNYILFMLAGKGITLPFRILDDKLTKFRHYLIKLVKLFFKKIGDLCVSFWRQQPTRFAFAKKSGTKLLKKVFRGFVGKLDVMVVLYLSGELRNLGPPIGQYKFLRKYAYIFYPLFQIYFMLAGFSVIIIAGFVCTVIHENVPYFLDLDYIMIFESYADDFIYDTNFFDIEQQNRLSNLKYRCIDILKACRKNLKLITNTMRLMLNNFGTNPNYAHLLYSI